MTHAMFRDQGTLRSALGRRAAGLSGSVGVRTIGRWFCQLLLRIVSMTDQRSGLMSRDLFTGPTICADSLASIDPD
jgi:hypothetical protein